MTPKEKAADLVENFYNLVPHGVERLPYRKYAIQCAIIAVEEILSETGCGCCKEIDAYFWKAVISELRTLA